MFSLDTPSHLFTLLCLGASVVTTFASPVPPAVNANTPAPVPFGPPRPRLEEDLKIFFIYMGEFHEHAGIVIDETILHTERVAKTNEISQLQLAPKPEKATAGKLATTKGVYHWETLGKTTFKDEAEQKEAIAEMWTIKLPLFIHGGTCLDFIERVLQNLKSRNNLVDAESVIKKWRQIRAERAIVLKKNYLLETGTDINFDWVEM